MFIRLNENPFGLDVGDCVIRAISTALGYNWFMVHDELSFLSRQMAEAMIWDILAVTHIPILSTP